MNQDAQRALQVETEFLAGVESNFEQAKGRLLRGTIWQTARRFKLQLGLSQLSLIFFVVGVVLYFAPWANARSRKHHQADAIGILNLLLGWTVLGWIVALIWSASAVETKG